MLETWQSTNQTMQSHQHTPLNHISQGLTNCPSLLKRKNHHPSTMFVQRAEHHWSPRVKVLSSCAVALRSPMIRCALSLLKPYLRGREDHQSKKGVSHMDSIWKIYKTRNTKPFWIGKLWCVCVCRYTKHLLVITCFAHDHSGQSMQTLSFQKDLAMHCLILDEKLPAGTSHLLLSSLLTMFF